MFLNDAALQVMPAYINLGFNTESKQLYIKKSTSKHGFLVQNFPKKIYQLTDLLKENQISFPVCYHLVQPDKNKPFWIGTEYRKDRLSPLEKKVFQLTINGHTETDIIKQLSLSEQYYNYIMEKIEALYYKK